MQNNIYIRRKNKVIIERENGKNTKAELASVLKNVESLGYLFSKDVISVLKTYSPSKLKNFENYIIKTLKDLLGAKVKYNPMYPNFPQQVMEMDYAELYLNAILHYVTVGTWIPEYEKDSRTKLKDKVTYKVIDLGIKEDFLNIFKNILNAKVAVSVQDKEDVEWFIKQYKKEVLNYLPEKIENKENLSYFIALLKNNELLSNEVLKKYFKTATDVLRYITSLSGGDESLVKNTKFKNFKRADRKLFLTMLEASSSLEEDMKRNHSKWVRVGEILHPGEYHSRFPRTFKAFNKIRNNENIQTFNGKFEKFINEKDAVQLLKLVKQRPGEFARRLDWILRKFPTRNLSILNSFESIAEKISTTILLQIREYFHNRNNMPFRVFIPKGSVTKIMLDETKVSSVKDTSCKKVFDICTKALIKKFKSKEKLGKVYVDECLKDFTVPFALRSVSKSFRTVSRGSKIKMEDGKVIRLFIHWKNLPKNSKADSYWGDTGRVDLDLSACFYNNKWEYMEHVSYTNLRSDRYKACHSGDITNAPNGASEFIDVDIESALKFGAKYVVMNVICFTTAPFFDIPECYAGCMMRTNVKSGEIYEPKTVKDKFNLTSESRYVVPLIFDLEEKKIIWVDCALTPNQHYGNNVESNQSGLVAMGKALTNLNKPNLYDLFTLHAKARGKLVPKSQADVIFSYEEGITPFDIEKIVSEYL